VSALIGKEVLYSGRVQGVGFRQSVYSLAGRQRVTGFVQNLDNGKVRLVLEGEAAEVEGLLANVRTLWSENISEVQTTTLETIGATSQFGIRH